MDDDGYLIYPDGEFGRFANPDLKPFSAIAATPCLVLLGEPGIGKSRAIQGAAEQELEPGVARLSLNLRQFSSEDRLFRAIFESEPYRHWLSDESVLEILLDSLDECLIRIGTVVPILEEELRSAPVRRLRLRIACRTASWPATLEEALLRLWGADSFGAFELAPLRREDVRLACEIESLSSTDFLNEVQRVRAQSLAMKPVTLRLLLGTFRQNRQLPSSRSELYERGCRLFCDESPERRDCRIPSRFDADQKLAVAKRIAAVTIFSNRFAVWKGPDNGEIPTEDLALGDLAVGKEAAHGHEFAQPRARGFGPGCGLAVAPGKAAVGRRPGTCSTMGVSVPALSGSRCC